MTTAKALSALVQGIAFTLGECPCENYPADSNETCKTSLRTADADTPQARWCLPCLVDELMSAEGPDLYDEVTVAGPGKLIVELQGLPKRRILDAEGDEDYVRLADVLGLVLTDKEKPPVPEAEPDKPLGGAPPATGPAPNVNPDTPLGGGPIGATTWQAETDPNASPLEQAADALRQKAEQDRGPISRLGPESDF